MNKLGLITFGKSYLYDKIIKEIGENNKKHILLEEVKTFKNDDILKKIEQLDSEKVDFIAMDSLEFFSDFNDLQERSPLLILHPIDTLVIDLAKDLNQFPLWILNSKLAKRLLDLHGFSYQIADKSTKENFEKLKTATSEREAENIITEELKRYKPYGVDSIVFSKDYKVYKNKIDEIDIYFIEDAYLKEIIKLLNK